MISIITPLYNSARYLPETVRSVQAQSVRNWEMIIVDDASEDNGAEIARSFAEKDERIRVVELAENSGPAVARNRAIELARGRYIAFLDADDLWKPEKLGMQLAFMQANDAGFSYTGYHIMNEEGERTGEKRVPERVTYHSLLKTCPVGCLTAMYDTQRLGKLYMPSILKRQDYGLWLKILKQTGHAYGLQEPLADYRVRSHSVSSNKLKAAAYQWKIYRDVEKLPLHQSLWYFGHYAVHGVLNRM